MKHRVGCCLCCPMCDVTDKRCQHPKSGDMLLPDVRGDIIDKRCPLRKGELVIIAREESIPLSTYEVAMKRSAEIKAGRE